MNTKDCLLYKTLCGQVRKSDHKELLRQLRLVRKAPRAGFAKSDVTGFDQPNLSRAFVWNHTPQGHYYWSELARRMRTAGHKHY